MICSGFGHREIFENIQEQLYMTVLSAIDSGCDVFYTGAMDKFDSMFSSAVREPRKDNPNIKLICIMPYMTANINRNREYYAITYDDIIVPDELAGIHFKASIKARNQWIVDHSDIIICYTIRDYGGAYDAIKYAYKKRKCIYRL